jgi:hypothetical protein
LEYLKDASLRNAPALLTSIRIGLEGLLGTNTLAFYKITAVKSFNILSPVVGVSHDVVDHTEHQRVFRDRII